MGLLHPESQEGDVTCSSVFLQCASCTLRARGVTSSTDRTLLTYWEDRGPFSWGREELMIKVHYPSENKTHGAKEIYTLP